MKTIEDYDIQVNAIIDDMFAKVNVIATETAAVLEPIILELGDNKTIPNDYKLALIRSVQYKLDSMH